MATIVEFRAARRQPQLVDKSKSAEVVLFPGVRYERWGDSAASARSLRSRDTLELAE